MRERCIVNVVRMSVRIVVGHGSIVESAARARHSIVGDAGVVAAVPVVVQTKWASCPPALEEFLVSCVDHVAEAYLAGLFEGMRA